MTFLPIVERELRVAARKRSTFWLRVVAALVGFIIGGCFLILSVMGGLPSVSLGSGLFGVLTWLSLAVTLSSGLFFTSDCLSEEKREGTLGFLFLTDLRGYDVVLGKLLATSLRGCSALLAVFPMLAITLLMGGVAGSQFWKTILALVNALCFSLAAGLFVSAISRESQKGLAGTFVVLLFLVATGPVTDAAVAAIKHQAFIPVLSLVSPGYLFVTANTWGASAFWYGLLINQLIAWLLLGLACFLIPRMWQERTQISTISNEGWAYRWKYGGGKRRATLRRKLIEMNPVLWLTCRERWQSALIWLLVILAIGAFVFGLQFVSPGGWIAWGVFGGALTLALYLGIASQACRFFVEGRRSGLIELLLTTPLTVKQIVQGQWRALLRMFRLPVALFLGVQLFGWSFSQQARWGGTAFSVGGITPDLAVIIALVVINATVTTANLIAISWFGMWTGLTSRSTNFATLKTLVFVQVIPWFVASFVSVMILPLLMLLTAMKGMPGPGSRFVVALPLFSSGLTAALLLAKDILFSFWARRRLYSAFREQVSQGVAPVRFKLPPALPRPNVPPVIPAKPCPPTSDL